MSNEITKLVEGLRTIRAAQPKQYKDVVVITAAVRNVFKIVMDHDKFVTAHDPDVSNQELAMGVQYSIKVNDDGALTIDVIFSDYSREAESTKRGVYNDIVEALRKCKSLIGASTLNRTLGEEMIKMFAIDGNLVDVKLGLKTIEGVDHIRIIMTLTK